MKLHIEKLTPFLLFVVLFFWGCAGCAQKSTFKDIAPHDDYAN